jgi:drug/metabolite transporter (DMT)-like permease
VTTYFVLVILAAQAGSPVVVQTCLAATPLIVLAVESWRARTRPEPRILFAASLVLAGIAVSLAP